MSKISQDDVKHAAKLANLELTKEEIKKFTPQLGKIIDYISELSEVDTNGVEPTSQTTGLIDVYREDRVTSDKQSLASQGTGESLTQDEALSGTDVTHNGYFKVGAILSERSDK